MEMNPTVKVGQKFKVQTKIEVVALMQHGQPSTGGKKCVLEAGLVIACTDGVPVGATHFSTQPENYQEFGVANFPGEKWEPGILPAYFLLLPISEIGKSIVRV
jgi:hypothetical protein